MPGVEKFLHRPVITVTLETEAGGEKIQGLPGLHSEFKASVGLNLKMKMEKEAGILKQQRALAYLCKALGSIPSTAYSVLI